MMKRFGMFFGLFVAVMVMVACDTTPTSDQIQHEKQEQLNQESTRAVGMPNVKNFREKRQLKTVIETRDQENFATYTYVFAENTGKFTFLCNSIGYGIPYATQYTNPEAQQWAHQGWITLPQADPNGLFSPSSADGTWVICADPVNAKKLHTVYIEPKITALPFKLPASIVINP